MATLVPIPFPPTVPFLGNVMLMDKEMPLRTFTLLAQQYGEIYGFKFPDGSVTLHINSQSLVAQVSDDKRFKKVINNAMQEVRNLVGDGLFSAYIDEPAWGIAREYCHCYNYTTRKYLTNTFLFRPHLDARVQLRQCASHV